MGGGIGVLPNMCMCICMHTHAKCSNQHVRKLQMATAMEAAMLIMFNMSVCMHVCVSVHMCGGFHPHTTHPPTPMGTPGISKIQ